MNTVSGKLIPILITGILIGILIYPSASYSVDNFAGIISLNDNEQVDINTDGNNPMIELRDKDGDGGFPFIDLSNDAVTDFDVRIILLDDDVLSFQGARIDIDLNGEFVIINSDPNNPSIELRDGDGDGGFPFIDFSNDGFSDFDARFILLGDDSFAIQSVNLGIDKIPTEKLDVAGNIKLTGNILSDGDICIGACP